MNGLTCVEIEQIEHVLGRLKDEYDECQIEVVAQDDQTLFHTSFLFLYGVTCFPVLRCTPPLPSLLLLADVYLAQSCSLSTIVLTCVLMSLYSCISSHSL